MIEKLKLWSNRFVNFILAATLAIIFITFLAQIFARYAPRGAVCMPVENIAFWFASIEPIGWTVNVISLL